MAENILNQDKVQPYHFSQCSLEDYNHALKNDKGRCLLNRPNELEGFTLCGNGVLDEEEECDCGTEQQCELRDPCCDPITCRLRLESQCSNNGSCCHNCKVSLFLLFL